MTDTSVLFGKRGAKIGALQLDATVEETHEYENQVSQWPVEDGSSDQRTRSPGHTFPAESREQA